MRSSTQPACACAISLSQWTSCFPDCHLSMIKPSEHTGITTFPGTSADETARERFARGIEVLEKIGGEGFDIPVNRLAEVAPDLARFTIEFAYGDILSRPGLDLRLRQIVTIASLMTHGSVQPQLKYHMTGFLNAGGEPAE